MICYTNKHKIPFQIDEEDYESVSQYLWYINAQGYPATTIKIYNKFYTSGQLRLHEFLGNKAPRGLVWDHKDRDKLNNHRLNLQLVTRKVNNRNQKIKANNNTGVKGIKYFPKSKWYLVTICGNEFERVGKFRTLEEAVSARKAAEIRHWGQNY